jgi:hypothetical protein
VLVTGGQNSGGNLNSAELYDFSTGVWTIINNMTYSRVLHTASDLINGKVLVAGTVINSELYQP